MLSRAYIGVACVLVVAVAALGACSTNSDTKTQTVPQAGSATEQNPRFLAADLPLLPQQIAMGPRPVEIVRAAYEFAARRPDVMKFIPCFCGCESSGHKDNHDCFVGGRNAEGAVTQWDLHGIGCAVCIDVAFQTRQMHAAGTALADIRDAIEKKYAGAHGHTATPLPKRGSAPQE